MMQIRKSSQYLSLRLSLAVPWLDDYLHTMAYNRFLGGLGADAGESFF